MSDVLPPAPSPESADPPRDHRPSRRRLLGGAVTLGGATLLAGATGLGASASAAIRPYISTRAQWQARAPRSTASVLSRVPDHIVVHHTASANSTDYSVNHAYALSRSIQNHHMDGNGWADVGQQFTISRGGYLMEGRNRTIYALDTRTHVVGAQCAGHNEHTVGIECEGLYTSATPTTALWSTLVRLCAYLCDLYSIPPSSGIVGHRNYVATACPGNTFYGMLPRLRQEVAAAMGPGYTGAAGDAAHPLPDLGRGLEGPRRAFDHGPALAKGERG